MDNLKKFVWPVTFCIDKEEMWFIYKEVNICKYNFRKGIVEYVAYIPRIKEPKMPNLFFRMHKVGDYLVLIPTNETQIVIYNIKKNSFIYKTIIDAECPVFISSYEIGEYIYLIPFTYRYVLRIRKYSWQVEEYIDVRNQIGEAPFFNDSCQVDQRYVLGINPKNNVVYIFDMKKREIIQRDVGDKGNMYEYITTNSEKIVVVDNRNKVIRILQSDFKKENEMWIEGKENLVVNFVDEDKLLIDSIYDGWYGIYDFQGRQLYEENCVTNKLKGDNPNCRGIVYYYNNSVYYYNNSKNNMQEIEKGWIKREMKLKIDECFEEKYFENNLRNNFIEESRIENLAAFVKYFRGIK